jgi:hypothetical protein
MFHQEGGKAYQKCEITKKEDGKSHQNGGKAYQEGGTAHQKDGITYQEGGTIKKEDGTSHQEGGEAYQECGMTDKYIFFSNFGILYGNYYVSKGKIFISID